jgi:hypothetical protein
VSGCVRHGQTRPRGKIVDAPLALAEMFQQLEPMGVGERLGDLGKTGEYALLRACPEITESAFERVKYRFTTEHPYHMLWW